ncbi:MAG: hypothetical protein NTY59_10025 [Alphaproteobacteria bacterium]|nr:hypothetical protein [Alphaproteobacteria bacterium]
MPSKKASGSGSSKQPYLKGKNAVQLCIFVGANLAVFLALLVSDGFSAATVDQFWHRITAKDGFLAAIIPILAIVLCGVFSDKWKARLVFWRWRDPLPGCRVFSELLATDHRIDKTTLAEKLGEYPREADKQNALWFSLYKRHGGVNKVLEAHRIYLMTRDMASISSLFVILFPLGVFAENFQWEVAAIYAAALLLQYVLIAISARNYGNRFVLNVLVEESQT